jgi:esterase/lipase superfamily enzyme
VNVIDISSVSSSDGLGHDRYATLARFSGELAEAERRVSQQGEAGAFIFDAAGALVSSPFRLAGKIVRQ